MNFKKLLQTLEERFKSNIDRHEDIEWLDVKKYLCSNEIILKTIKYMEDSGGQPDLVLLNNKNNAFYVDMSKESPSNRRSICYDKKARENRKKNPPENSAIEFAKSIGADILTEKEYKVLQNLEDLDTKTSSWLLTPESIRNLGGAIFGDQRYGQTFIYHNGADSYYKARGVRLKVYLKGLI